MAVLLLAVAAYLVGALPVAYLVARWTRGVDLRSYGSGNVGSSNVVAAVSKRWAVPVILWDLAKGIAAVYVPRALGIGISGQLAVGLAAIAGHNWPVFLKFRGGRGIMTMLGVDTMLVPGAVAVLLAVALLMGLRHHLGLGTIITIALMPAFAYFLPAFSGVGDQRLPVTIGLVVFLVFTAVRRMTGKRAAIASSLSWREVALNRLLFDRDIRDREAWVHRAPEPNSNAGAAAR